MIYTFSEVLEIHNGKNQRNVENKNGNYPIYGSGGIIGFADKYLCDEPAVIIGRKGSINNPLFVDKPFWNVDTAFALVPNSSLLDVRYLYYFCLSYNFNVLSTTVTIPSLTKFNLLKVKIEVPSLEEQKQIVHKLDKIEMIIGLKERQLKDLEGFIRSRFLEMFGDIQHNPCKWDIEPLSAVCHKITDGEHGSVQRVSEGYVYLNAKNIRQDGNIDWENITHISFKDHAKIFKRCNPEPDDILLTTTGTVGNIAIVPKVGPFSIDRGITLLKINNDRLNNIYLANLLNSEYLQQCMKNNIHASAIGHLFLKQVKSLSVMLPPLHLQNQFADYVVHIDKSKMAVQRSLDELETLKKSLMQTYFG